MADAKFINGLIVKPPHANAPEYVICKLSMKREELIEWLQAQDGDWVNAEIKRSREGKFYAAVDEWKPEGGSRPSAPAQRAAPQRQAPAPAAKDDFADDDIPF